LASGSREDIRVLTKNGADLVCALSSKMNVVNNLEDGLSSRCTHNLENLATSLKVSIVPEDMALFFLEFVFDENDISLLHRVDLFLYRFFIILLEPKPFVYQSPRKCTK
jgi:hypothetical protein